MDNRINFNKYDPVLDAERSFDIEWALNKNWDALSDTLQSAVTGYNLTATYNTGDLVNCNGMLYVSLQDSNTGNDPETAKDWWKSYAGAGSYWIGTRGEYDAARAAGEIDDDTICYITDDDGMDDRIKAAIEEAVKKYIGTNPGGNDYEQLVHYTMLYDQGNECGEVTGGWTTWGRDSSYSGFLTFKGKNMVLNVLNSAGSKCCATPVNAFSREEYVEFWACSPGGSGVDSGRFIYSQNTEPDNYTNLPVPGIANYKSEKVLESRIKPGIVHYKNAATVGVGTTNISFAWLVKSDTWQPLCTKAGITAATMDVLLSSSASCAAILSNADAVNYMIKQCTGDFMVAALQSSAFKIALAESSYKYKVIANPHWAKFMMMLAPELLNYTMLYDQGDECGEVTGGWKIGYKRNIGTYEMIKNQNTMSVVIKSPSNGGAVMTADINKKINLTDYIKLYANITVNSVVLTTTGSGVTLTVSDTNNTEINNDTPDTIIKKVTAGKARLELNLNCGLKYPRVGGYLGTADAINYDINAMYALKPDPWKTWMQKGNVTGYSTLSSLLANGTALTLLMTNKDAIEYMLSCTGDLMLEICNSATAMSALVNNIAYDLAFEHPVWHKFMLMCPVSLAANKAAPKTDKIPTMTSNTLPSGIVTYSSEYSDQLGYRAFDKTAKNWSTYPSTANEWMAYEFAKPNQLFLVELELYENNACPKDIRIEAYNGTTKSWDTLLSMTSALTKQLQSIPIKCDVAYKKYRLFVVNTHGLGNGIGVSELQFYGKAAT